MGQKLFRSLVPDRRSRSARSTESSAPAMADTLPAASAAAQAGETSKPSEPGTSKAAEARPAGSAGGRRIVCGIDGSEGSLAAFRFLKDTLVNPERGDRVTLVRAMEPLNRELVPTSALDLFPVRNIFLSVITIRGYLQNLTPYSVEGRIVLMFGIAHLMRFQCLERQMYSLRRIPCDGL